MNIGNAIKEIRKEKGMSQREFASASGLTQTSLSQIESGLKRPNPGSLKKICDTLGISETVLYLLATEIDDIPEKNRAVYGQLFPNLKKAFVDIFR